MTWRSDHPRFPIWEHRRSFLKRGMTGILTSATPPSAEHRRPRLLKVQRAGRTCRAGRPGSFSHVRVRKVRSNRFVEQTVDHGLVGIYGRRMVETRPGEHRI